MSIFSLLSDGLGKRWRYIIHTNILSFNPFRLKLHIVLSMARNCYVWCSQKNMSYIVYPTSFQFWVQRPGSISETYHTIKIALKCAQPEIIFKYVALCILHLLVQFYYLKIYYISHILCLYNCLMYVLTEPFDNHFVVHFLFVFCQFYITNFLKLLNHI